jgi:hypothetical protein
VPVTPPVAPPVTPPARHLTVAVTYETWNQNALDIGETDDRGYLQDEAPATCREAIETLEQYGASQLNVMPHVINAYQVDAETDYRTGETTTHCVHITGSPRNMARVVRMFEAREACRTARARCQSATIPGGVVLSFSFSGR